MAGRRWACGLRRHYGSWPAAYASPEYVVVRLRAIAAGVTTEMDFKCEDWPPAGETCATCGGTGG